MRRTQIQFDEDTYAAVRQRAFETRRSISRVVRETVAGALKVRRPAAATLGQFRFVGAGRAEPPRGRPVSEDHDAALAQVFAPARGRRR